MERVGCVARVIVVQWTSRPGTSICWACGLTYHRIVPLVSVTEYSATYCDLHCLTLHGGICCL